MEGHACVCVENTLSVHLLWHIKLSDWTNPSLCLLSLNPYKSYVNYTVIFCSIWNDCIITRQHKLVSSCARPNSGKSGTVHIHVQYRLRTWVEGETDRWRVEIAPRHYESSLYTPITVYSIACPMQGFSYPFDGKFDRISISGFGTWKI